MSHHCGISLKGKQCHVIVFDISEDDKIEFVDKAKIGLEDDKDQSHVIAFLKGIQGFISDHSISSICIRGRAQGGGFAGGAVTFKMEALIQSCAGCIVTIVPPQSVAAALKRESSRFNELSKPAYLKESFDVAYFVYDRGID